MERCVQRQSMIGDRVEIRTREFVVSLVRRRIECVELEPQRGITRRRHLAARAIASQPGRKFVAPCVSERIFRRWFGRSVLTANRRPCRDERAVNPRLCPVLLDGTAGDRFYRNFLCWQGLIGKGLRLATENFPRQHFAAHRAIHEHRSLSITVFARATGSRGGRILALFATFPCRQLRAKFTVLRPKAEKMPLSELSNLFC